MVGGGCKERLTSHDELVAEVSGRKQKLSPEPRYPRAFERNTYAVWMKSSSLAETIMTTLHCPLSAQSPGFREALS